MRLLLLRLRHLFVGHPLAEAKWLLDEHRIQCKCGATLARLWR
jgi:hypothetical protein